MVLSLFNESSDPVLTTSEVAEELDFSLSGTRKRLYQLNEDGIIDMKKAGNSPVWWLSTDRQS
ncbi:hypothetical protein EXE44_16565 [Halorubrum sp. SS7]|nr:hypothetical protein EXE42_14855 [Halorubrum sp. SP3]TKX55096.1 hypothetical protein EXE44_16565 [Halorubrum sp. SS7]